MPIHVYIAPFTWYEKKKQQESHTYRQLILDALETWRKATNGLVRFNIVDKVDNSQIDFKWRRVDRHSLGHCAYEVDNLNRLFSAAIQIGISDGFLHAQYQDAGEVKHTVLHEIGHALGLREHSDEAPDIMYVPHQYGVYTLSERDIETIQWLYRLPVGFDYRTVGKKYNLQPGFTIDHVIDKIEQRIQGETDEIGQSAFAEKLSNPVSQQSSGGSIRKTSSLEEQHQILSEMGRFYLKTQGIQAKKPK
jgi:Matrixin